MKLRHILNYLLATLFAYGAVLILPMLCDYVFDTHIEIVVITWLNIGMALSGKDSSSQPFNLR